MLMPKEDRKKIHKYLLQEGVLVAKKDFEIFNEEIGTRNLYVVKALQSLNSKGFVKTQFSWQYYYYTLTDEGIEYLREWLHVPAEVVPATHRKAPRPTPIGGRSGGYRGGDQGGRQDDGGYRRRDNKEFASGNYQASFNA